MLPEAPEELYFKKKKKSIVLRLDRSITVTFSQITFFFLLFLTQHEYDKTVEEKDTELKLCKIKEQEQLSLKRTLVRHTLEH